MESAENPLSSALTDMVTSLMVIFILLLVTFLHKEQTKIEEQTKKDAIVEDRVNVLSDELKSKLSAASIPEFPGIQIEQDKNDPLTLLVIVPGDPTKPFFETGNSVPTIYLSTFLKSFARKFLDVVTSEAFVNDIQSVIIEGHTDKRSGIQRFGNLRLSQERSREVMTQMIDKASDQGLGDRFLTVASAAGRGERDCKISADESDLSQAPCRKVVFKVRVKSLQEHRLQSKAVSE
jgi:flagellar motor protein MotB